MFLVFAVMLFGIFATNVALGSFGSTVFLGDVGEMLMLLASSIAFVVAVLKREAATRSSYSNQEDKGRNR